MRTRIGLGALALATIATFPLLPTQAAGPTQVAKVPAGQVGVHGPIADYVSGQLELVGRSDVTRPAMTTPLGNHGGIALIDHCLYLGRWHDYGGFNRVQIIDVANPAAPVVLPIGVPNTAIKDAVAREIRAIDLPGFKMLTVQTFSYYLDAGLLTRGQNALRFYTFPSGDCTQPVLAGMADLRPFRPHEFFQWIDPNPAHNVDGHPRILEYVTTPLSGMEIVVYDASRPSAPKLLTVYHSGLNPISATEANVQPPFPVGVGSYSHSISISPDGRRAYISQWDGGYFTADTSRLADASPIPLILPIGLGSVPLHYLPLGVGNTHSAVRAAAPGSNTVVVGDEVYATTDGCPYGWMHVLDAGGPLARPKQLGQFKLPENNAAQCTTGKGVSDRNANGVRIDGTFTMHNQTVTPNYVLTSWYGGGLRVVNISNPGLPAEAGFFVPKPLEAIASIPKTSAPVYGRTKGITDDWWVATWSYPIIRDGLIYVADIRNGLYILRAKAGSALETELSGIPFLEGNSNLGDFK